MRHCATSPSSTRIAFARLGGPPSDDESSYLDALSRVQDRPWTAKRHMRTRAPSLMAGPTVQPQSDIGVPASPAARACPFTLGGQKKTPDRQPRAGAGLQPHSGRSSSFRATRHLLFPFAWRELVEGSHPGLACRRCVIVQADHTIMRAVMRASS